MSLLDTERLRELIDQPLAINGGPRAVADGPPGWPRLDAEVRTALDAAWRDGAWGRYHAGYCQRLAETLAQRHGVEHALVCSSGTFAVELALRGLGIGPGDEVALAGYDFAGNFRAIEAVGARPALVDIRRENWSLDAEALAAALKPQTRAAIVSHLHGGLADMPSIRQLADRRGLMVVEDACQSPGAKLGGRAAGAWGDVGVFSFGGSKLLTAGRGGAIITPRPEVMQRAKIYCERGNNAFALPELSAALLLPQWERLDEQNARRRAAADAIIAALGDLPAIGAPINQVEPADPSYYKLGLHFDADQLVGCAIDGFVRAAQAEGVAIDRGFRGFAGRSARRARAADDLLNSRRAAAATLVLHHPVLLEAPEILAQVAAGLHKACAQLPHRP